jgi:hypothetical protein
MIVQGVYEVMNTACQSIIQAVNTEGTTSYIHIPVNKPFKDHLKQLYSEWFLAGSQVLAATGVIKNRSIELLCQWIKTMAMDLAPSACTIISSRYHLCSFIDRDHIYKLLDFN